MDWRLVGELGVREGNRPPFEDEPATGLWIETSRLALREEEGVPLLRIEAMGGMMDWRLRREDTWTGEGDQSSLSSSKLESSSDEAFA
jgi:hypothetical protein